MITQGNKRALAVSVATAVGGVPAAADAATFEATLTQVLTYSNQGTAGSPGNITSSTATFTYDDVTDLVTQTGGLYNVRFTITPSTTLFRTSITGLVIGNAAPATAVDFVCAEGNFGGNVGASICGNYSFGPNFTNESTATWGPGTEISRTIAGDDAASGNQQSIAAYNGFTTISSSGTELVLSNASCNPAGGGAAACTNPGALNTGLQLTFTLVELVTGPADDEATVEADTPTVIPVLANDTDLTDPVTVTLETPPTNGNVQIDGGEGAQAGVVVTYTPNPGYTGPDTFTYRVVDSGSINDTAVVTITVVDTVPDAFTFASQTGVARSAEITSGAVTVAGISTAVPISVAGGTYSIGCTDTYTAAAGTINNGDDVCVRQTSSANFLTETVTTLTIGGVDGTFTTETEAEDTIPDAFSFAAQTGVALSTAITSAPAVISGINSAAPISVTGGQYSIDGGDPTAAAGTINDGQSVTVIQTSSAAPETATIATLTIGGISADFSVTTLAAGGDVQPDPFEFENPDGVDRDTVIESNVITITGIDSPADVRISGPGNPEFRINGGAWQPAADVGSITNGQTLQIRHTSASTAATAVQTTITIGNPAPADAAERRQGNFTSITAAPRRGGSSAADGLVLALLGAAALRRRRRKAD